MQKSLEFARCLFFRFRDDDVPALGAQLTYYLILAFFPFLIFLVSMIGFLQLEGEEVIRGWISVLPADTGSILTKSLNEVTDESSQTLVSVGMIATIWAASNGINAVIKGLNKAYDEEENRPYWKVRGVSILATLILAVVILLSLFMLIFGKVIGEYLFEWLSYPAGFEIIWGLLKFAIPLLAMIAVFTLLYWVTPNRRLTIKEVIPGAIFTSVGWVVTSLLFSFYVNQFGNYTKTYGSLGGVIVLLIWLYLSSIIILLGGEINATLAFSKDGKSKKDCKKFGLHIPFFGPKKPTA